MSLVFVGHRCCDHSPSSGYDQICALFPEAGWLDGRELAVGQLSWLRAPTPAISSFTEPPVVFHVFYGDCSGSPLPAILRARFPQATILSTVHQPAARLARDPAGRASLHHVDGVLTVSQTQARQLVDHGLAASIPGSIHVIPHGVWTRVFRPAASAARDRRDSVLFVGNYLRDWDGTREIVKMLAAVGVRSVVLGSAAAGRLSVRNPLVEISPRVSEPELVAMYHRSVALVLPVTDATASNALLEAMAAGCPVICPRLPSLVNEYLGDDSDAYLPGRYTEVVACVLRYVRDAARRAARSAELMHRAERFDWARLRPRLIAIYQEIVDRPQTLGGTCRTREPRARTSTSRSFGSTGWDTSYGIRPWGR